MTEMPIAPPESPRPKQRHGCLTAWLILMIVANAGTAIVYLTQGSEMLRMLPGNAGWALPFLIGFSVFNVVCAIALWQWKRWGFWGFCVSAGAAILINFGIGLGVAGSFAGVIGIAILYGVLQIGGDQKGWTQLE